MDIGKYDIYVHTVIQHDKDQIGTLYAEFDIYGSSINLFETAQSTEEKIKYIENCEITKAINQLLDQHPKELRAELLDNIIFSGNLVEMESLSDVQHERNQILNMFNSPHSTYRVKYQTSGEEAIQSAINFSKLPNFKDYCSFWFDCEKIVESKDTFI